MEQHDAAQQSQQASAHGNMPYAAAGSAQRLRPAPFLQSSPTPAGPTGRRESDVQQVYGFAQGSSFGAGPTMQAGPLQYASHVSPSDAQRQQAQQFSPYGDQVMYAMTPSAPSTSVAPHSYDGHYSQRASVASDPLTSPFGIPQSQYYLPGPTGPVGTSTPQIPLHYQEQQGTYTQSSPATALTYSSNVIHPSHATPTYSTYVAQPQPQYALQSQPPPSQTDDQAFNRYQAQTRNIFSLVSEGALRNVHNSLLDISQYLLGNAENLGLTRDDDTLHEGRIRLWDEFNRAWLVSLQRQLDLTEEWMESGQPLREPRSIMSVQALELLAEQLVRLCDSVERHGLVDYQMGVAEEEIMDVLLRCLAAFDPPSEKPSEYEPRLEPSATVGASRDR